MSIFFPPIIGLYYGTLDIWGDDWDIVKNYKYIHEFIFTILAITTALILFIKGVAEQFRGIIANKYNNILQAMIAFFNDLVKKKKDRFYKKSKDLKSNTDIFKNITHPKEQIEHAFDGAKRLLKDAFNIDPKNIAITIIQGYPLDDKWWYEFKCDTQKQHTKAREIMMGNSTAKYCYDTGDSIFIPDIRKGEKEQAFLPSERSKKSQTGSIYCKSVRTQVGTVEYTYIFTIVVYSQFICTPYDEDECRACERLLDEISDRIELELYLHAMKCFRENGGRRT